MSMEDMDNASTIAGPDRPLPPEVNFTTSTATFSGTAAPGLTIKLSSNVDGQAASVTVGKDGKWKIVLGEEARWYTIFRIWTRDSESGQESDKVQFTLGGYNPKLEDVYVGEAAACGHAPFGSEIAIYASSGKLFALAKAMFGRTAWRVKYLEENRPEAGDRVCVIAKHPNGNTSMPHFTEVQKFSLEEAGNCQLKGSGARPGDLIQLFDEKSGEMIETVEASDDGTWTLKLANQLESNASTRLQRVHKDGAISRGPGRIYASSGAVPPTILGINYSSIWGTGIPGADIMILVYPQGSKKYVKNAVGQTTVDSNGNWSTTPPYSVTSGYTFTAGQQKYPNPSSQFHAGIVYGKTRPLQPMVGALVNGQYTGFGDVNTSVLVSSPQVGTTWFENPGPDGSFYTPNPALMGIPSNDTVLFNTFTATDELDTPWATSSSFTGRQQSDVITVDMPIILKAEVSLFSGTEATLPTSVEVYDETLDDGLLRPSAVVQNDNSWNSNGSTIDSNVANGHKVYAIATYKSSGGPGPTSQASKPAIVGVPINNNVKVPVPPQITQCTGLTITGMSQANTYVTLNYTNSFSHVSNSVPKIGVTNLETNEWSVTIPESQPLPTGSTFWATAEFDGSTDQSDPYYRVLGEDTEGPITVDEVNSGNCTGRANRPLLILGWRTSDGKQIVNFPMQDNTFDAPYSDTLDENDTLNLVGAISETGDYTPFNRQDEGYKNPNAPPN